MKQTEHHNKQSCGLAVAIAVVVFLLVLFIPTAVLISHFGLGKIERLPTDAAETVPPELATYELDDGSYILISDNGNDENAEASPSATETEAADPENTEPDLEQTASNYIDMSGLVNILLIGQDARPGEARARSDTMILVSLNPKTNKVALISFLRDLYVQIPGYYDNRLNAAFAFGGVSLLYDTFEVNFGFRPDGCFVVRFEGLEQIIDALGGVDVEFTTAETAFFRSLGHVSGWYPDFGINHLNGEHAVSYARLRAIDGDFNRTGRQRAIMTAVFDKFKKADLGTLLSVAEQVLPYLSTDLSNSEIIDLISRVFPMLSSMELNSYYIPAAGTYYGDSIRGMSVLVPDLEKIHTILTDEYLPF